MRQQLITQCPTCRTRFEVNFDQLRAAAGQVRCSNCQLTFVATQHLESRAVTAVTLPSNAIPREALVLSPLRRNSNRSRAAWSLLILLALSGAGFQLLWFERNQLSHQPLLAPIYAFACQHLNCRLPPRMDLSSIRSQKLLIRQHKQYANAVTMDLILINQAPFDQPFPALQLSFSGLDNSLHSVRSFEPHEYLGGDISPEDLMPSNSPVQAHLDLLNSNASAPNYQLQFLRAKNTFLNNK